MKISNLSDFQIQPTRGYLPPADPLERLSTSFEPWDDIIGKLPRLLADFKLGEAVDKLPLLDDAPLQGHELGRAKSILGMLAQAYVWEPKFHEEGDNEFPPRDRLPPQIATPLISIGKKLDEPPIFNYADYVLRNWRAIDPAKALTIDNLTTLATFSDRDDEKMFVVVHVAYEYAAGRSFGLGEQAMAAAEQGDINGLMRILHEISAILRTMRETFLSVKDVVSPEIFRNHIRLFLKGWKNNTDVGYGDIPAEQTRYRGETGSQSSVIPFFDALLGVHRQEGARRADVGGYSSSMQKAAVEEYLDFRNYMPLGHRKFIAFVEGKSGIRETVVKHDDNARLVDSYNQCIDGVVGMRQAHASTVDPYIGKPGQLGNLGYGTGGSDYQEYLGALREITESGKVASKK
uniref:Indoleamine 2,3-dioxygenase n=1 Tax=Candidatus Kentrum sp. FM TaxID=2126340 RepID=A0A450SU39_9GAMM|nr:MAG: indoleamine 2,3-dioxygenase [Candidatus Kentron sp. FM]VFJ68958.1 MAG: indoleamine 2,3-dioxygenase [Candidatus Kentron sp. FM]VFK21644.1 MAG: indoleamine 2,3-dioxygenase [Candidatus Kentron sp. FM]